MFTVIPAVPDTWLITKVERGATNAPEIFLTCELVHAWLVNSEEPYGKPWQPVVEGSLAGTLQPFDLKTDVEVLVVGATRAYQYLTATKADYEEEDADVTVKVSGQYGEDWNGHAWASR